MSAAVLRAMVVGCALWASAAFAGGVWPDLEVLAEVPADETTWVRGIPVRVRAVLVRQTPQELIQQFVDSFERARLYVPPGTEQPRLSQQPMLTAYDPRRQVSYTVIFQANPDGTTTLVLGESHLAASERQAPQTAVPIFPGAAEPVAVKQEGAEVITYRVAAEAGAIKAFYAEALGRGGFSPAGEEQPDSWVRGAEQVKILVNEAGAARTVIVLRQQRIKSAQLD